MTELHAEHEPTLSPCPADYVLVQYAEHRLAKDVRDKITDHLACCYACSEVAAELLHLNDSAAALSSPSHAEDKPKTPKAWPEEAYGFTTGTPLGRYVILAKLGSGGMGDVYVAYDPTLDRKM